MGFFCCCCFLKEIILVTGYHIELGGKDLLMGRGGHCGSWSLSSKGVLALPTFLLEGDTGQSTGGCTVSAVP